jgi:acetylornithine deacetylase/succinyl-diaminopimelate desuccinylase-like protein
MPQDHPGLLAVADVLAKDYGKAPFITRSGGTLPIMDMFLQELNAYTVVVGTSLPDERIHSPNEFFRVSNYDRGQRIYALLFEKLGQVSPSDLPVR